MAVYNTVAAENAAQIRENRSAWDSFIDGLNRLPRPLMAMGAIGLFVWAPIDPVGFSAAMAAYALVPQWIAAIMIQVIALFFGGRYLTTNMGAPSLKKIKETLNTINDIKALEPKEEVRATTVAPVTPGNPYEEAREITEDTFEKEMADTTKPLSLNAIVEWNKRN